MSLYSNANRGGKTTPPSGDSTQKQTIVLFPHATLGTARLTPHQRLLATLRTVTPGITPSQIMSIIDILYISVTGYSSIQLRHLWNLPAAASVRAHLRDNHPVLYRYIQTNEEILIREVVTKANGGHLTFNEVIRKTMEWENYFAIQARDARTHLGIDVIGYNESNEDDPF